MDFVSKVRSQLFNMLSRLVITFLPRSRCLLISWLQPPSAVILEPNKIKSVAVSIASPSICHEVMGPDAMIVVFWMLGFKPSLGVLVVTQGEGTTSACFLSTGPCALYSSRMHMGPQLSLETLPPQISRRFPLSSSHLGLNVHSTSPCHAKQPFGTRSWWVSR